MAVLCVSYAAADRVCEQVALSPDTSSSWFHVAFAADAETQMYRLIVNGVDVCGSKVATWFSANMGGWQVGACQQHFTLPPFGLADLRLWSTARASESIRSTLFKELPAGTRGADDDEAGLVGSWKLNDAPGCFANDSTANGHAAVLWDMELLPCNAKPYVTGGEGVVPASQSVQRLPYRCSPSALRKSVVYTNGESLIVHHGLADWIPGNPGYVGLYQAFSLADGSLRCESFVNVARCLLGIGHSMGSFPSAELFGIGVVVGQGTQQTSVLRVVL